MVARSVERTMARAACAIVLASTVSAQVITPAPTIPLPEVTIEESFADGGKLDLLGTGALWGGGRLVPAAHGGSGIHGEFRASDGMPLGRINGRDAYEWSTDSQVIPAARSLRGAEVTVTGGRFEFASFVVHANEHVVFRGSNPARILVSGTALIEGTVDVSAPRIPDGWDGSINNQGQPGGPGGPGGAPGGRGGHRADRNPGGYDGEPGGNVVLPPGHPYAGSTADTGGRGSVQYPANASLLCFSWINFFSRQMAGGGGGGSLFQLRGSNGTWALPFKPGFACDQGLDAQPGGLLFAGPVQKVVPSDVQFVFGGSGGGGGGTNAFGSVLATLTQWQSGGAGAGGAGGLRVRAGRGIAMLPGGELRAVGGDSGLVRTYPGSATPGGGGSGGTILLQSPVGLFAGVMNLLGGNGGEFYHSPGGNEPNYRVVGGSGGPGYLRVEQLSRPSVGSLGSVIPTATVENTGTLDEQDLQSAARSLWYLAQPYARQSYLRYEIEAEVGGNRVDYSDDPRFGLPAVLGFAPFGFFVQGARMDRTNRVPLPGTETRWFLRAADLNREASDGVRWTLVFDKSYLGTGVSIVVRRVVLRLHE